MIDASRLPHRAPLVLASLGCFGLIALSWSLRHFILDDAYVTFRYARNFVEHGTLAWNVGQDPVEGFTSFLWVQVSALGHLLSLPPAFMARTVSLIALAVMVAWFAVNSRRLPWLEQIILVSAVGLNAILVLHASQGMETATASAVVFAVALAGHGILTAQRISPQHWAGLYTAMIVAALLRPETVIFSAVVGVVTLVQVVRVNRRAALGGIVVALPFLVAGLAYMMWRYQYFGFLLPNTAYIKSGGGVSLGGITNVRDFLVWMVAPYALYAICRYAKALRLKALRPVLPVLAGVLVMLVYFTTVSGIQGYLFRFPIVIYPAILLILWAVFQAGRRETPDSPGRMPWVATTLLLAVMVAWPVSLYRDVGVAIDGRSQVDRVLAGRALAHLDGTLVTSEAGALPYYSGWESYDLLGLTSEDVVHDGLTIDLMDHWSPDLVALLSDNLFDPATRSVTSRFLESRDFIAVAAVMKHGLAGRKRPKKHIYFADPESPIYDEIVVALQGMRGVRHVDIAETVVALDVPVANAVTSDSRDRPAAD